MANYSEYSKFEQWSLMKYLVVEKYKPCEIYKKMCVEKHILVKEMFTNGQPELKRQFMDWKYTDSPVKEKVSGTAICKEGHADSLLVYEMTLSLLISLKKVQL